MLFEEKRALFHVLCYFIYILFWYKVIRLFYSMIFHYRRDISSNGFLEIGLETLDLISGRIFPLSSANQRRSSSGTLW